MSHHEHLLTIVEPIPGGDSTLGLAHDIVARGGSASVVVVITDRVRREFVAHAEADGLGGGEAEARAIQQLRAQYRDRIGGSPTLDIYYGALRSDVVRYVTPDTTAIAIPECLVADKLVERIAAYSGRPVIVAPGRPALLPLAS